MNVPTLRTQAIVLTRTDYGEADRILTILTPDHGKLRLLAKGVRRVKSKLAGGIELFSISDISFLKGRGEIGTLVSTRLQTHYGNIINDLERVQLGYDLLKQLNRVTEDQPEPEYFDLLQKTFKALNEPAVPVSLIRVWFAAQLLQLNGHAPNLRTDSKGQALSVDKLYTFDFDVVAFTAKSGGQFTPNHIKALRLLFANHDPQQLLAVQGVTECVADLVPLATTLHNTYTHR